MYRLAPIGTDDWTENKLLFDETTEPPNRGLCTGFLNSFFVDAGNVHSVGTEPRY